MNYTLRKAVPEDIPAIERLMRASFEGLCVGPYSQQQVDSALLYVARLDPMLVHDGGYFVAEEAGGRIVGSGGWSRRAKLYAGSAPNGDEMRLLDPAFEAARVRAMFVAPDCARRGIGRAILVACEDAAREAGFRKIVLMAMLSGQALYDAAGYRPLELIETRLVDGTSFPCTLMEKEI